MLRVLKPSEIVHVGCNYVFKEYNVNLSIVYSIIVFLAIHYESHACVSVVIISLLGHLIERKHRGEYFAVYNQFDFLVQHTLSQENNIIPLK